MKIIAISDIHNDCSAIGKLEDELLTADMVIIAGDITHMGSEEDAKNIITEFEKYNENIFAVSGNCDKSEIEKYLKEKNISVHKEVKTIQELDLKIAGLGGSVTTPVPTPNTCSEDEYRKTLESIDVTPDIFVAHQPPLNTVADMIPNGMHVGSSSLKEFIEKKQPPLCICGHIHESVGKEYCGKTLIINPGSFKDGFYAIVTRNDKGEFSAELSQAV